VSGYASAPPPTCGWASDTVIDILVLQWLSATGMLRLQCLGVVLAEDPVPRDQREALGNRLSSDQQPVERVPVMPG